METHELFEAHGATTLRITQVCVSKEARDGAAGSGMDEGMAAGFKQIDAVLAQGV